MLLLAALGLLGFVAGVVYASTAEWTIHRFLMHRPLMRLKHFYKGHAKVHHVVYQGDESYFVGTRPRRDLTFAWWAMPFPVAFHLPMLAAIGIWVAWPLAAGMLVAFILYQTSYETLHYFMHFPANRWVERRWLFQWINNHHRQHHVKHGTNLNVVLPLADFVFGTRRRLIVHESLRGVEVPAA